jgi:hypothetical protein
MSTQQLSDLQSEFSQLSDALSADYDVKAFSIGSRTREGFDTAFADKSSNLSDLLRTAYDLYSNQNLGAIVLATDGIYNEGSNPLYAGTQLNVPVYTVALGDTTPRKDLLIKRVFHNKIVYLGDKFSVQVDLLATNCAGSNTQLTVQKIEGGNARNLAQFPVSIDKNDFFVTREITLDAERNGVQHFRIVAGGVPGEITSANNVKDIFIDVLDARQKIILLANSPHPDLAAIKSALETSKNYQVTIAFAKDMKVDPAAFDFVVLHQLPSRENPVASVLQNLDTRKIPQWYIAGTQTDFARLNQVQSLVEIRTDGRNINQVQATISPNFNLFTLSERLRTELPALVPLTAPFGDFRESGSGQTLLYQRIGKVDTKYPLLTVGEVNGVRKGVLAAEGVFSWRLFDYLQHQNHEVANELLLKTVQYISLKADKRKFRVNLPKNIFNENEPVVFDAELYNENFELINEPDASISIRNSEGQEFPFTFSRSGTTYHLEAGIFPVGNYTYRANTNSAGQQLTFDGQFSVQPIQLESYVTTADHGLLRLLSQEYGGQMLYPGQLGELPKILAEKSNVKPVIYSTMKTRPVINLKWIFFLLLSLLTLEWFLRRYYGGY